MVMVFQKYLDILAACAPCPRSVCRQCCRTRPGSLQLIPVDRNVFLFFSNHEFYTIQCLHPFLSADLRSKATSSPAQDCRCSRGPFPQPSTAQIKLLQPNILQSNNETLKMLFINTEICFQFTFVLSSCLTEWIQDSHFIDALSIKCLKQDNHYNVTNMRTSCTCST